MLKILCFSGDHQFFQILSGIKSRYDWGRKFICSLAGEASSEKFIDRSKLPGASHRDTWTRCFKVLVKAFDQFFYHNKHQIMIIKLLKGQFLQKTILKIINIYQQDVFQYFTLEF